MPNVRGGLYSVVETAALMTDRILVGFSGGKDSVVTLDLCVNYFKHVECYFMYYVNNLSFQESICRYYEDKYGIPIHRIPHFELSRLFRYGVYRLEDFSVPIVSVTDVQNYMRHNTDIHYVAAGERIDDSIWRRATLKSLGIISPERGRIYPVADWNKAEIRSYIKQKRLPVGQESKVLGHSFGGLFTPDLLKIREFYPEDFTRIKEWFPLVEAGIYQAEVIHGKQISDV